VNTANAARSIAVWSVTGGRPLRDDRGERGERGGRGGRGEDEVITDTRT
jgi:hypothetical protein